MPNDTPIAQGAEASTPVAKEPKQTWRRTYVGHWQKLSLDEFEAICHIIYYTPPPHAIHLGCLFDLLRVRRRTEEAAVYIRDAVNSPFDQRRHSSAVQLSKLKKACSKLSEAYKIDEYACTIAVENKGILDDAAARVLKKEPDNLDAKSGEALNELQDVIGGCASGTAAAYKTRATFLGLLHVGEKMMMDLTAALEIHKKTIGHAQQGPTPGKGKQLEEIEMPEGLRSKLLVQRGLQYLFMACAEAMISFSTANESPAEKRAESQKLAWSQAKHALRDLKDFLGTLQYSPNWPVEVSLEMHQMIMQVPNARWPKAQIRRTRVCPSVEYSVYPVSRLFEARPPDDLPDFLPPSPPEYQPSAPSDFLPSEPLEYSTPPPPPPPYGLAVAPGTRRESVSTETFSNPASSGTDTASRQKEPGCEFVTYHPYLVEALHGLLICHCLIQTSPKVIQRHAYMVARLTSLIDGFPLFEAELDDAQNKCYSDIWRYLTLQPESSTGLLPLSLRWPELCKRRSSQGIAPGHKLPGKDCQNEDRSFGASASWTARAIHHWLQEKPVIQGVKKVKKKRTALVPVPAE
ncbi:hypothetical protein ISF_02008 [Cordyceps fumosorosea ARSEF 2679]|uniref:Uncharacterized protein n=1 Tax=Cordyceps fumosorosea (strain ARSEF 2679) TaxID=1081104 RepID=A0A168CJL5_CORFA|nr:hypothetical protein ISF_02008 [Cordyceps fumosorosea ARSEF 2679]OAA71457.1 hypothetical protein ISF_02008 [Cordyceps fumosorosea ARSEF 2679]